MKVLIAEDSALIRSRLVKLIGALPDVCEVIEADDVPSTLKAIESDSPQALVLDLSMPGGTGLDVIEAITNAALPIQIIVLSALVDSAMREICLDAGAQKVFDKGEGFLAAVSAVESLAIAQRKARQ